jgi:hypothetical protein
VNPHHRSVEFKTGDIVHVNSDDPQWGRIAYDGVIRESKKYMRTFLVYIPHLRADVLVKRADMHVREGATEARP